MLLNNGECFIMFLIISFFALLLKDFDSFYDRWIGKMKRIAFKNFSCSVKLLCYAFIDVPQTVWWRLAFLQGKNEGWHGIMLVTFWIIHTHKCANVSSLTTTIYISNNVKKVKICPMGFSLTEWSFEIILVKVREAVSHSHC